MIYPKRQLLLGFLCILTFTGCLGQNKLTNTNADVLIDNFFSRYETNTLEALDKLLSTNEYMSDNDIKTLNDRVVQYSGLLGEYQGHETLISKNVGQSVKAFVCLLKYDRQPIRFIITLYKPNDKWKVLSFKINDSLTDEIEEATLQLSYKPKM